MRKIVAATLAVAMLASSVLAIAPANAQNSGAIAAGVLGGLAVGAIIASQPRPYYAPAPVYVEPACRIVRERYWDGYAWRTRRVEIC